MKQHKFLYMVCALSLLFLAACEDDDNNKLSTALNNDCIKRTLGPNVVGLNIDFVYAMALPPSEGKIVSAQVEASIAGASGTYLEHRSFYTDGSGSDVPVVVGNPSVTSGAKTEVAFVKDTCAASLRYYYKIPAEAKGKQVEFTFSAQASNGQTISYKMGPYDIAKMDMALDLVATDGSTCYISLADMAVYDAAGAAANAAKIDLVYLYRKISGITFEHAFVSPAADAQYLSDVALPSGVHNNTLIREVYGLRDRHLARLQYGIYVDDPDFLTLDFTNMPNYAINVKNEGGVWVETQDGKYRAYIYVNIVNPGSSNANTIPANSARISIKRYTLE
ncbi:hypothetical protein EZS27_015782 [termite gut metagenome]|uniref:DUF4466 domain-containing protein n=1 Tax=termite gut metagenome TaxID=433724 RepID=A0A5J4RQP6_9ZZZZ